ncbi:flagellar motor switch protein FliN [Motiliproteus sp. MSK22-1]|uniref:flagellar motor switch protein FliN n=1 Tax=Motiliproteus sp. MSK22-1 TaxID=1897630 RepID=UPI000977A050|nr:flagellar motor switch protein FliN [Motiliproteus sp. MSK22-1]OMH30041.1 flagellar motor switch protein FliN [Motiliproteus sp. MSK22-1]
MSDENQDEKAMADEWAAALDEQGDEDGVEDAWAEAMAEQGVEEDDVSPVALDELQDDSVPTAGDNPDLDVILDIPVNISMEVGSTEIAIRNLLQLSQGSVIELDRMAGEPLDVRVNGTLIAHGEVVVVNERFGIRLTDVVSPSERIRKLR